MHRRQNRILPRLYSFLLPLFLLGAAMSLIPTSVRADSHFDVTTYQAWLADLRIEALAAGISTETFDQALASVVPLERVISADRNQPETIETHSDYIARRVDETRITLARERLAEHRALLEDIAATYGVPARYIVSLWGMESAFGRFTGTVPVVDALVTLAYDPRRARFFRRELLAALEILDGSHIALENFKGSWAGAVGQVQFLPSNFLAYAVDHDGDGRRDLWGSQADVFASAANFLRNLGWVPGGEWGEEVRLPAGIDAALADLDIKKPLSTWATMGITTLQGESLLDHGSGGGAGKGAIEASLVLPDGLTGHAYLVRQNYRVILRWNRSHPFGTSIGLLADAIADQ